MPGCSGIPIRSLPCSHLFVAFTFTNGPRLPVRRWKASLLCVGDQVETPNSAPTRAARDRFDQCERDRDGGTDAGARREAPIEDVARVGDPIGLRVCVATMAF